MAVTTNAQNRVWDYPVKPDSKEWAKFTTGQQMVDACQIPFEILIKLSTKELVKICIDYPLLMDYVAFNDEREGIKAVIQKFNGFQELGKRDDGVKELILMYADFPIITQIADSHSAEYHIPYKLLFLELLIADDLFIDRLSHKELVNLKSIVVEKYTAKAENPSVYSLYNIKRTMLLASYCHRQKR